MRALIVLLGAGLASAALLAGCGDAKTSGPPVSQAPGPEISAVDLARMPLPIEELGLIASGLETDAEASGSVDNARAAAQSIDPSDTAASVAEAGRLAGNDLRFSNPKPLALNGKGLINIESGVDIYTTNEQAAAALRKPIEDVTRLVGTEIEPGFTVVSVDTFDVTDLGDQAVGVRLVADYAGTIVYQTAVGFATGRLIGSVAMAAADSADRGAAVEALARELEKRMRG